MIQGTLTCILGSGGWFLAILISLFLYLAGWLFSHCLKLFYKWHFCLGLEMSPNYNSVAICSVAKAFTGLSVSHYTVLKLEIWDFASSSPSDYFPLALLELGSSPLSISMVSDVFPFFPKRRDVLDCTIWRMALPPTIWFVGTFFHIWVQIMLVLFHKWYCKDHISTHLLAGNRSFSRYCLLSLWCSLD